MNDPALLAAVSAEVVELHAVFEDWFCGNGPGELDRVEAVLAPNFTMVPPSGLLVQRSELLTNLSKARGLQQIKIEIDHLVVIWQSENAVLAGYDEVQHHAAFTTHRRSTALLSRMDVAPNGLMWRHVHETWIDPPPD